MKRIMVALVSLLAVGWFDVSGARKLELADYLDYEEARDPQVSPRGDRVVYARRSVNKFTDGFDNEIWQMDAEGRRDRFLLKGGHARWSPDGTRIAYVGEADGKAQLFVRWMDDEGATTQITHDDKSPQGFAWSPDGRSIAFSARVPMTPKLRVSLPGRPAGATWKPDPPIIDRLHYRYERAGIKTGFSHLFVVSAEGGTPRQVTSGEWDVGRYFFGVSLDGPLQWSADGRRLLFGAATHPDADLRFESSSIYAVDVDSGELHALQDEPGLWAMPVASPDGKYIAYVGSLPSEKVYPGTQLRVMDSDGGNSRVLLDDLERPVFDFKWADNSRAIYLVHEREGTSQIRRVSLDGKLTDVTTGTHRLGFDSSAGDAAFGVIRKPHVTPNVATINLRNGDIEQLTDVNGDIFADVEFAAMNEIWYDSTDDTRVQGWVITPPDFDPSRKYPLILEIHGGPHGMHDVAFDFRAQDHAAQGYVVLYVNPRGSVGYGIEFTQAINHAFPGRVDFDDLMAGVDAVIERGYIDESRQYVTGCSAGGALTNWIIGHTNRFAAAAPLCSMSNWISQAGTSDVVSWYYRQFQRPFWEDPTPWLEHSPLMHVHKVTTPTMLITGESDLRTPLTQAEEFYTALRYNGVEAVLIPMRNEWHGTWVTPSNMLRTQLYLRTWFERHGGGSQAGE